MAKEGAEPPNEVSVVASISATWTHSTELATRYFARPWFALAQAIVGRRTPKRDVAQDSLLLAFRALPSIEESAKFAAWLAAITDTARSSRQTRARAQASRAELDEF